MLKSIAALGLLTYGLQSVYDNDKVFYAVSMICLAVALVKKSILVSIICGSLILIHLLTDFTSLDLYWPAPVVISSLLGFLCLNLNYKKADIIKNKPDTKWMLLAFAIGISSIIMIWNWMSLTKINPNAILFKIDSHLPIWIVGVTIFAFATLNSFAEEFLFRGPIFEIENGSSSVMNLAQSIAFGLYHFKGFPFGLSGAILAFTFALLQGYLRIKSQNFYYVWISHFTANVGMGILLYQLTISNTTKFSGTIF